MEPILTKSISDWEGWLHQVKWDGIRGLCYLEGSALGIFTKNGHERSAYYPELSCLRQLTTAEQVIFDGEIIALNEQDKPSFEQILRRERVSSPKKINYYADRYPVKYVVFDILSHNGRLLTAEPLKSRLQILRDILTPNACVAITDDYTDGQNLFAFMQKKGWEGIVSKNPASPYSPGKHHHDWFKTKIARIMLAAIGGIQYKNTFPNSLLLGVYRKNELHFIGKASLGLKQADFQLLNSITKSLEEPFSPFQRTTGLSNIKWLKPALTCWVEFFEWTANGQLRHPKIAGFSSEPAENAGRKEQISEWNPSQLTINLSGLLIPKSYSGQN
jgi:bifunctional non-homologous end joining protein LigD